MNDTSRLMRTMLDAMRDEEWMSIMDLEDATGEPAGYFAVLLNWAPRREWGGHTVEERIGLDREGQPCVQYRMTEKLF